MSNSILTPTVILKEMLHRFENNLVSGNLVYRGVEDEFAKSVNGYKPGSSVTISRPVQYTVNDGAVATMNDIVEGSTTVTVDKQKNIPFKFSSADMSLSISDFSRKYIEPAMIKLANQVDTDVLALYKAVPNLVGTAGQTINSFTDFAKAPERLDLCAVPSEMRVAALSPTDQWGLLGNLSGLYINDTAKSALEKAKLPALGGVECFGMQNVQTHTVGTYGGTPLVNGANQVNTYSTVKSTMIGSLITDGWTITTTTLAVGDVFTIAGVYDVNPVSKATLPHLKPFVVTTATSTDGSGNSTIAYSPAMISSGAYQNVSAAPADNAAISVISGTSATGYAQNIVFHKNAFALTMVPMEKPQGAVGAEQVTYNGMSMRMVPFYDGVNDVSSWRLDILYGVKALNPELATRIYGSA